MRYLTGLHIGAVLLFFFIPETNGQTAIIPTIVLKGDDGGCINGEEWHSSTLKDKINLLLYVDPGKQSWVKPLVDRLDSLNYSPDVFGITFIVNAKAAFVPHFFIKKQLIKREKISKSIRYVLDQNKILVKEWKLEDNSANVLLFASSGEIILSHHGKIEQEEVKAIIDKINESLTTMN